MYTRCLALLVLSLLTASAVVRAQSAPRSYGGLALREIVPPVASDALINPGMGLYLNGTLDAADVPADAWFAPLIQIGYFRDDWSVIQPDGPGRDRFDAYFAPIFDLWVTRWHKRVAFRFMAENMHSRRKYVTPAWVFAKGVPSVKMKGLYADEQIDPVFWDERYLAVQEQFIADLGRYLDGRPGLEFIDIGSIGEWGEMHLQRWTPEQLRQTGYTQAHYIAAYRRIIDAFARAFPHTRVFLNVGDYEAIDDFAAIRGLHFRQDGLTPSGPSANVGKRFFRSYSRRGVICNYELYAGYEEMKQRGWGVQETFAKGLEDPISYFHVNLMGFKQLLAAPNEVKQAVTAAAARIGFRFALTRLRCSKSIRVSDAATSRILLDQTWTNEGVAPCYASYALRWTLEDAQGHAAVDQTIYPSHPTTLWWPGEEVALKDVLNVPAGIAPGVYHLKVAMFQPENPSVSIALALTGRDSKGSYDLGVLPTERRPAADSIVYTESFEQGAGGWTAAAGMTVQAGTGGHTGPGCLLLTGTQPGGAWNYAALDLKAAILPASRYRLSCWMKVDSLKPDSRAPYVKIGLSDPQGNWITNVETNHYDMSKPGTWQRLLAYIETTPDTGGGQLAIEKGSLESRITASLRLDDVKLELLESP
jgi:hypothetical protein